MDDNDDALSKRATQERLLISKLTREDLEDKYLKIYDENILLKKHARKQEDRIKKMATKLIRLVNDKKKSLGSNPNNTSYMNINTSGKQMRDVETEEYVAELESKLSDLELQNKKLRENLQISKIQLQTLQTQKNAVSNIYSNVTARIDTGLPRRDPSLTKNIRTLSTNFAGNASARSNATARQLHEMEQDMKMRIDEYETHIESLSHQLNHERQSNQELMYKLKTHESQEKIVGVQDNIDQIRLQRELKEKANQYTELYSKFNNLSQQHIQLKDNHDRLLEEIERYNQHLKQEQQRNMALKTELKNSSQTSRELLELRERVEDVNRENEVLKDANQKLLNSAFSLEREREFRERERALKIQIAQLEATLKADVGEKGTILDKLNNERDQYDKLNGEMRDVQVKYFEMKQKYDDMNEKMQFLSKESNIDFSEIEEALILVKERRSNRNKNDEFLNVVDAEKIKIYQRKMVDLEAQLAETIGELDKSRHLLITQVKINDDYKKEVFLIQSKMEENKAEYDTKMLEYAQLLDLRAARIKKLERQLRDVAYGTRQVKIGQDILEEISGGTDFNKQQPSGKRRDSFSFVGAPGPDMLDHHLIANLERGQNIFEIHLTRLILTEDAMRILNEQDPSTFCTIEFFEHELQTTPIIKGQRPEYNFTSQYIIKVDDFFLHYLQKQTTTIELHQAIGSDYETKAACQISFRDLIDKQIPRIHGNARLICVNSNNVGVNFGSIEYWARLIVPVDEAFRLYKERTKALGYLASNAKAAQQADAKINANQKMKSIDNMNELNINLLRCSKVNSLNKKSQPSPYCVYKFYDFYDHDTEIIKASNYPEFNDHKSFAVPMDMDLDKYLKKEVLSVYVFDDNEPEDGGQYLGVAKIPLIGLAHDKDIKGTFELKKSDGGLNGTIDITLYWQYTYMPPSASTFAPSGSKHPTAETDVSKNIKKQSSSISLMPGENLSESASLAQKAAKMGVKLKPELKKQSQSSDSKINHQNNEINSHNINNVQKSDETPTNYNSKRNSIASNQDDNSVGNSTIHRKPENMVIQTSSTTSILKKSKSNSKSSASPDDNIRASNEEFNSNNPPSITSNQHYNDTMFGDENPRTYSPNELDSLRHVYQTNVTAQSEDEREIENPYDQEEIEDELYDGTDDNEEEITENQDNDNFKNYQATVKSEDDLVIDNRDSWDPNNTNKLPKEGNDNNVIIEISNFTIKENSQVLKRDDIQNLFVGMEFLNYDPAELEAQDSMPKPKANQPVHFNFRKIFPVDSEMNLDKRELLASMIDDKNNSKIRLALISEPTSEDQECEDIGYAFVDIQEILRKNENFVDKELKLYDANDESVQIGKMVVTVEILDALNAIRSEMRGSLQETI